MRHGGVRNSLLDSVSLSFLSQCCQVRLPLSFFNWMILKVRLETVNVGEDALAAVLHRSRGFSVLHLETVLKKVVRFLRRIF